MFIGTHIAAGLIIGKLTNNYPLALASSLLIDLDHLIPYIKHKVLFNPKKLWKVVTDTADPYGDQRNYLHSFFTWLLVSIIISLIDFQIGLVISLGYLSHLLLDLLDNSDFYPFYPLKYKVLGPVKYFSIYDFIITGALLIIFIII